MVVLVVVTEAVVVMGVGGDVIGVSRQGDAVVVMVVVDGAVGVVVDVMVDVVDVAVVMGVAIGAVVGLPAW